MKRAPISRSGGFTLAEMMIAIPAGLVAMAMLFAMAMTTMDLLARNLSINLAHVNTRNSMNRIEQDIFQAVSCQGGASLLQLTGTPNTSGSFPLWTGSAAAPGIALEVFFAGPFQVAANCSAGATSVPLYVPAGSPAIASGMNLVIQTYYTDVPITAVSTSGSTVTCTLKTGLPYTLNTSNIIPANITLPVHYYVSGSNMIRQDGAGSVTIQNNVITTGTLPFSQPSTAYGTFLSVTLAGSNPDYSNLGFNSSNMSYNNIWVPAMGPLITSTIP